jgi:hypothetical protein
MWRMHSRFKFSQTSAVAIFWPLAMATEKRPRSFEWGKTRRPFQSSHLTSTYLGSLSHQAQLSVNCPLKLHAKARVISTCSIEMTTSSDEYRTAWRATASERTAQRPDHPHLLPTKFVQNIQFRFCQNPSSKVSPKEIHLVHIKTVQQKSGRSLQAQKSGAQWTHHMCIF